MSAKMVTIIAFFFIAAGLSGYGLAEIIPNDTSLEEILDDFSKNEILVIPSSSTQINP